MTRENRRRGAPGRRRHPAPDAATLGALGVSHAVTRADERPEGGWVLDAGDWAVPERRADGGMLVPLPGVRAGALVELRYRPDRRGGGPITILSLLVWGAAVLATAVAPAFAGRV